MLTKGPSHQPRFGMYSFTMPNVHTAEEKAEQKQVLQEMCDTFKQQEGALISYDDAFVIQPRHPRVPAIKMPACVKIDNTTAEESILGRIQTFLRQRDIEVDPSQGEMTSTGNPPFDTLWKLPPRSDTPPPSTEDKRQRIDPEKKHQLDL